MDAVITKTVHDTITIGYSGKKLGNTNLKYGPKALANIKKFNAEFPGKTAYDMPAVGQDRIINIDNLRPDQLDQQPADALVTTKQSALLTLRAADCIPLAFFVPGQKLLALAHVGTSGAALHLPAKLIKYLELPAEQLQVYVGPFISQQAYRFPSKDISDKQLDDSWADYITDEADGLHLNLLGYVLDELKNSGIKPKNIEISEVDTGTDQNYYSHRRHKLTGEVNGRNCFGVCLV